MKLIWLGYLVYSLGNCAIKLYIETGLMRIAFNNLNEDGDFHSLHCLVID